jgi:hypothetical protein
VQSECKHPVLGWRECYSSCPASSGSPGREYLDPSIGLVLSWVQTGTCSLSASAVVGVALGDAALGLLAIALVLACSLIRLA